MNNEQRLREALEASKKSVVDDGHIYLSTPERLMSLQDEVSVFLASTEPEQPASEEEDCQHERFITITHAGGQEKQCSECGVLVEPSTTEGEPTNEELAHWLILHTAEGRHAYPPSHQWYKIAASRLALLAQPTAPSKTWTPAALEEWTPEQWAAALDTARTDLMCAEDFEPSDVAHVMNICAQVLRRPQEQGDPNDCRDCGTGHWYNFMVPDDVWKRIAPDQPCLPEEGGMLCAQCIDKRCAALGIEAEAKFYFKGEAVVSRYPKEQGERIWIKPHELADLRDDANGCAIIGSRTEDDDDDEGGDLLPATLIIHEPAQKERDHE